MEFKYLGRKGVIVVNGGTNDIDKSCIKRNGVSVMMTQFMQKYNNTNIIVVNIPHRHDLAKDSRTNLEIQAFNAKLNKIAKSFRHVALVEIDSNRKYFTKHGLHLNNAGKEWLAKSIATQTDKLINNINKIGPIIALNWKEETTNESVKLTYNHRNRATNCNRKLPVTISKDFLW
jgi:lysophospholipase L1-like esterase